ncbi:MAG: chromosome partitioning protein ParA [Desulfovibrio sp.]|nr:MAG: chromosome partitioning protein ParA [Desulfovibrio sp.]
MDIRCPKCGHTRTIEDSKIPNKKVVIHCQSCGNRFPLSRARSIGVMITKGGVGKTTTSVNLSAGLALEGHKVLLVDTDTQGQSAYMLGVKPEAGLADLVTGDMEADECLFKARENLWLLAGGKSLAAVKRVIARKNFGGEVTLQEALGPLESRFDFIIIDTSPGWDSLTVNVLFYVKELLVPVSLEVMSVQGLSEFLKSFSAIKKYHKDVELKYLLPTFRHLTNKSADALLDNIEKLYGKYLCQPIRFSQRVSEAPAYGMTIFEYAGGDKVVKDYKALIQEVVSGGEADE